MRGAKLAPQEMHRNGTAFGENRESTFSRVLTTEGSFGSAFLGREARGGELAPQALHEVFRSRRAGALLAWRREVRGIERAAHVLLTAQLVHELVVNDSAKTGFELSFAFLPAEAVRRPVEILQNLCDNVFAVLPAVKGARPPVVTEDAGRIYQQRSIEPGPVYVLEAIHRRSLSLGADRFHLGRPFHYLYDQPAPVYPIFLLFLFGFREREDQAAITTLCKKHSDCDDAEWESGDMFVA